MSTWHDGYKAGYEAGKGDSEDAWRYQDALWLAEKEAVWQRGLSAMYGFALGMAVASLMWWLLE